jgi:hypothetical protein
VTGVARIALLSAIVAGALTGLVGAAEPPRLLRSEIGGALIDIAFESSGIGLTEAAVQGWIETSARAVTAYYGAFPVKAVSITVHPIRGRRVGHGVTHGGRRPTISVDVGSDATRETLGTDWVMTHEMVHLAFPNMRRNQSWIEEGISTYVEPLARLRIGELTREKVWGDLVRGLPQGQPRAGDEGLDHTGTWGRTYWGGALFCLLADVEIRKETKGRSGLEDALRGIQAAGGSIAESWTIDRAFDAGDRATGSRVLAKLYDSMKATPVETDLAALWKELGVAVRGRSVVFDDQAPLASVRRAIEHSRRWY